MSKIRETVEQATAEQAAALRTAPCGNQEPHRAHTYGERGHHCLGVHTRPTSPDAMRRDGDHLVARLSPDAHLVTDAATCIVLVTPERRITISNVDDWRDQLDTARTFAVIYQDEANTRRQDEKRAAGHMYAGHIASLREREPLIDHLLRSPDHGQNTDEQASQLNGKNRFSLIREHQRQHGLR